jgi:hypothetical protein
MPIVLAHLKERLRFFLKPISRVWLLAGLILVSMLLAGWGLLHITRYSAESENRDSKILSVALKLKEQVTDYSKLTYDFLLQQDFSRMMLKEKQSDAARESIEQGLAALASMDKSADAHPKIENIRTNVLQFLVLTDKALETATEDGSAQKARGVLQNQVEPAFRNANESLAQLIYSGQEFDKNRYSRMRQQALMFIALLVGFTTLAATLIIKLRQHILHGSAAMVLAETYVPQEGENPATFSDDANVEARSLAALAFANRLSRVRKDSDDLKKLLSGLQAFISSGGAEEPSRPATPQDLDVLLRQGDKINHSVSRIQHIHDQARQFIERLNDVMNGMQKLATDGNVVALNVTIELAKLQSGHSAGVDEDKNAKVSEHIRALATSAASLTGKLAMVVSQFRYTQEDFTRHMGDLSSLQNIGADSLDRVRSTLQTTGQNATKLATQREELAAYLPALQHKMSELENQIAQLQAIYAAEIEAAGGEGIAPRSFKVISGGAA